MAKLGMTSYSAAMALRASAIAGAAVAVLAALALAGCYTLSKRDIFEVAFQPLSPASLAELSDAQHRVKPLPLSVDGRTVSAYWDDGEGARGVLLFFNGNGYGAEVAMRRLLTPARALGLDLVVFNYSDRGAPTPSMAEMRRVDQALYEAAAALPTPAAKAIFVGGHSLGATFALDVAAKDPVAGAFVAAPATTGLAMIHYQIPPSQFVRLRPDADYRQFDNLALAARVRAPILVVGSDRDEALPPAFTHRVYDALPADTERRELILPDAAHGEYFSHESFWRAVAGFFGLRPAGPLVGYLSTAR
jgi:pimeloyl-ACP methyl ester carboxylesterase